jgi:biopolymer transport protein ExbD
MLKKRRLSNAEIPTSSMADIAFLLLLFFLVATVIDVDTGIGLTLPQYVPPDQLKNVKVPKDRMAAILINANGDVLLDEKPIPLTQIKSALVPRIDSKIDLPNTKKLIVSIKTDRKTEYNTYVAALDQVKQAYNETRDQYSLSHYGKKFDDLSDEQASDVRNKIPIIISLAEPEQTK